MKTTKMVGYFDVKIFDKKVDRRDRKTAPEGTNITFSANFALNELPDVFKVGGQPDVFVRQYASRAECDAAVNAGRQPVADKGSVKFKIGASCRWFDKYGRACAKPANADLDGKAFEVLIDFARKEKKADDALAPSGYWANAIMFKEHEANPFGGEVLEEGAPEDEAEAPAPAHVESAPAVENKDADSGLPF